MPRTVRLLVTLDLDPDDDRATSDIRDDVQRQLAGDAADVIVIAATDDRLPSSPDPDVAAPEAHANQDLTAYLAAVVAAMTGHDPRIAGYLSPTCPECGQHADAQDGAHVVLGAAVVAGCEGYCVIDPNVVGIPKPHWQPQP
jgi:hypothetical protein